MRLLCASVAGFRRFADPVTVRLSEPLIAVVGPNEAGKSSFLEALRQLDSNDPIPDRDGTRRANFSPRIEATFALEEEDHSALHALNLAKSIRRCTFFKGGSGAVRLKLDPRPNHDFAPRQAAQSPVAHVSAIIEQGASSKEQAKRTALVKAVTRALESDDDYLESDGLQKIDKLLRVLKDTFQATPPANKNKQKLQDAIASLNALVEHEASSTSARARRILSDRRPRFLFFDDASRDLRSTYNVGADVEKLPLAFTNLARLAKLDLPTLARAMNRKDTAHIQELIDAANVVLNAEFSRAWVRNDVFPKLYPEGNTLRLHVSTPDKAELSVVDERSDGLRWFISLCAFLVEKEGPSRPILLVDEAERHLSYDAQANLINVLESQHIAQSIIYTTHSAGCLPSDLGTGIRPVIPLEGERSRIDNAFWTFSSGFSPLLLAMGLGPLAFTPARNVVIGEGASECMLLPTLLRQATGTKRLPFQVAPGASSANPGHLSGLLSEGGRVVFVLDGDDGGVCLQESLVKAGADAGQIRTYREFFDEPVVLEDLVAPASFADAVNSEIRRWQTADKPYKLKHEDLPKTGRAAFVDQWCKHHNLDAPSKPVLAQYLAEMASNGASIVADGKKDGLKKLHQWLLSKFHVPDLASAS